MLQSLNNIHTLIVHCSATPRDWFAAQPLSAQVEELRRWHTVNNGWSDIGYHYIEGRDGMIMAGRDMTTIGAHVRGHNRNTLGICLIGGHGSAATDEFLDHFTPAQEVALLRAIANIRRQCPNITRIAGHNEFANKACPGFNVPAWYASHETAAPKSSAPLAVTPRPSPNQRRVIRTKPNRFWARIFGGK